MDLDFSTAASVKSAAVRWRSDPILTPADGEQDADL
jgi:hypothetical protein